MSAAHLSLVSDPDDSGEVEVPQFSDDSVATPDVATVPPSQVLSPSERLAKHRAAQAQALALKAKELKRVSHLQRLAQDAVRAFPALKDSLDEDANAILAQDVTDELSADDQQLLVELCEGINQAATPLYVERKAEQEAERDRRAKADAERAVKLAELATWLEANQVPVPESFTTTKRLWGADAHLRNVHISVVELMQLYLVTFNADESNSTATEEFPAFNTLDQRDTAVVQEAWNLLVEALTSTDAEAVSKLKGIKRRAIERWATAAGVSVPGKPEQQ